MSDISEKIIRRKIQSERMLAGSAVINGGAEVAVALSWLSPDMLHDAEVKEFWKNLLESGDSFKAVSKANLAIRSTQWVQQCQSSLYYEEYARAVAEDHFYLQSLSHLSAAVTKVRTMPK